MKKIILVLLTVIIIVLIINSNKKDYYVIPDEAIRFRVIANSNSIEDQNIKKIVKENIEKELKKTISINNTLEETRYKIKQNIPVYNEIINNTLKENNYNYSFDVKYGINYFPEKEYKGIMYTEGEYESLLITLGEGNGDNWWCVLFPPLCLIESKDKEKDDVEYRFFIKDIVDKYLFKK
jgi:Stage II sporulation protein R (spore_II_R).